MTSSDVTDRDKSGRPLHLNAEQRRQRASDAGKAARSISAYVRRIVRDAPQLSAADMAALREIVTPVGDTEAYVRGLHDGAKLAAGVLNDHVAHLAAS